MAGTDPYWERYHELNEAHYRLATTLVKLSGCTQAEIEVPQECWQELRERLGKQRDAMVRLVALMPEEEKAKLFATVARPVSAEEVAGEPART